MNPQVGHVTGGDDPVVCGRAVDEVFPCHYGLQDRGVALPSRNRSVLSGTAMTLCTGADAQELRLCFDDIRTGRHQMAPTRSG